jgi:protease-4
VHCACEEEDRSIMRYINWSMCLVFLIATGCASIRIPLFSPMQPLQERVLEGSGEAKILLLDISGVITEGKKADGSRFSGKVSLVSRVKEELQKAEGDSSIVGIIVKINSPGGTVSATDTIYHELMQFKKRAGIRVIACLTGLATSGGYYVASVADEIIAHPTCITGGIGVIAMKFNVEELLAKIGIEGETIKSADKKDLWSPLRRSSAEERAIMQNIVDRLHERFVGVVLAGREPVLSRGEVEELADGRIFTADQALEVNIIDRIGYLDDAVQQMRHSLKLSEAKVIVYHRPGTYKGTIYSGLPIASDKQINLITINEDILSVPSGVRFMYLWNP